MARQSTRPCRPRPMAILRLADARATRAGRRCGGRRGTARRRNARAWLPTRKRRGAICQETAFTGRNGTLQLRTDVPRHQHRRRWLLSSRRDFSHTPDLCDGGACLRDRSTHTASRDQPGLSVNSSLVCRDTHADRERLAAHRDSRAKQMLRLV